MVSLPLSAFLSSISCLSQEAELYCQLEYRMCEDKAVNALMRFNFAGMADEVKDALAFKAETLTLLFNPPERRIRTS